MFGVILWCDPQSGAAVIWCEEREEIAYFDNASDDISHADNVNSAFDAGDLVQFEVTGLKGARLEVHNLRASNDTCHDMPLRTLDTPRRVRATRVHAEGAVVDLQSRRPKSTSDSGVSRRG